MEKDEISVENWKKIIRVLNRVENKNVLDRSIKASKMLKAMREDPALSEQELEEIFT